MADSAGALRTQQANSDKLARKVESLELALAAAGTDNGQLRQRLGGATPPQRLRRRSRHVVVQPGIDSRVAAMAAAAAIGACASGGAALDAPAPPGATKQPSAMAPEAAAGVDAAVAADAMGALAGPGSTATAEEQLDTPMAAPPPDGATRTVAGSAKVGANAAMDDMSAAHDLGSSASAVVAATGGAMAVAVAPPVLAPSADAYTGAGGCARLQHCCSKHCQAARTQCGRPTRARVVSAYRERRARARCWSARAVLGRTWRHGPGGSHGDSQQQQRVSSAVATQAGREQRRRGIATEAAGDDTCARVRCWRQST